MNRPTTRAGAAVAAGFCLAALGTDTLGSVRIPAAYCGVAGIKTTRGLVSSRGVVPLSWTFDHVGPLAKSVRDLGLLLNVLVAFDPDCAESVAAPQAPQNYDPGDLKRLSGVRLGRLEGLEEAGVVPEINAGFGRAVALLADLYYIRVSCAFTHQPAAVQLGFMFKQQVLAEHLTLT